MGIVLVILGIPILLFACALVMMWVPLPGPFPPPVSQGRNLMAAIITGVLGMGSVIALTVTLFSSFLQAGRVLDRVCTSLGLTPRSYMIFGRQYHGSISGRDISLDFMPSQGSRSAAINVYVGAVPGTRIAIGRTQPLLDCRGCTRLDLGEPELDRLDIRAQEAPKAHSLLVEPAVRGTVARLMSGSEGTTRELYLQPDRIWFRAHARQITDEQFRQWLDDLLALAEAVESKA